MSRVLRSVRNKIVAARAYLSTAAGRRLSWPGHQLMQEAGALAAGKLLCALLTPRLDVSWASQALHVMRGAEDASVTLGETLRGSVVRVPRGLARRCEVGLFDVAAWAQALATFRRSKLLDAWPPKRLEPCAEGWEMSLQQLDVARPRAGPERLLGP